MLIREFDISDTEEIMQFFYDTVHRINIRDYSSEQVDAWAPKDMDYAQWSDRLQSRMTYVAEEEGKVIGFAELEKTGHIGCFYCHADYQSMGVGTQLLNQIQLKAKKLGLQKLLTEASITARLFFERRGFRVITPQEVERRGMKFINYVMEKDIELDSSD
jgi:N-acetylglutamate synthase-like GNAT family acetyltransferase